MTSKRIIGGWIFAILCSPASGQDVGALVSSDFFHPQAAFPGWNSPDGITLDAAQHRIFVSEENLSQISILDDGKGRVLIDQDTPVFHNGKKAAGLHGPEGIVWHEAKQTLWVVEDRVGGRILTYDLSRPDMLKGNVVTLPGDWSAFAWESIDVSPDGEVLLCGSDLESLSGREGPSIPSGVILFLDQDGDWWVPVQRLFASFSAVAFGPDHRRAVYTCELTGEIGWLDLETRKSIGGTADSHAVSPEGIAVLPDGTFLVAEERGTILHVDPGHNLVRRVYEGESSIESLLWDQDYQMVWVTDDGQGHVRPMQLQAPLNTAGNALDFAVYYPIYSPRTVPDQCPEFLRGLLAMSGIDFSNPDNAPCTFREFTDKLPLIAANAHAEPIRADLEYENPIQKVQFVLFEPNRLKHIGGKLGVSLAGFAAVRASGDLVQTTLQNASAHGGSLVEGHLSNLGAGLLMVPLPASATVTPLGIASITFLGLGQMPDYSLVINPMNPSESFMVVYLSNGTREHYRLVFNEEEENRKNWVIGYSQVSNDGWQRLSHTPAELRHTESSKTWPHNG